MKRIQPRPLLLCSCLAILCGGCSLPWLRKEPAIEQRKKLDARLALATPQRIVSPDPATMIVPFDGTLIGREVVQRVRDADWFDSVVLLPPAETGGEGDALDRARALQGSFLLEMSFLESPHMEERNGWWSPNLLLWLLIPGPSLFVRDFDYTVGGTIEWRILAIDDGSVLDSGRVSHSVMRSLNHFQRGGRWGGFIRVATDEDGWRKIGLLLGPEALTGLSLRFIEDFGWRLDDPALLVRLRDNLPKTPPLEGAADNPSPQTAAPVPEPSRTGSGHSAGGRMLGPPKQP